jgi:hypothetical protein
MSSLFLTRWTHHVHGQDCAISSYQQGREGVRKQWHIHTKGKEEVLIAIRPGPTIEVSTSILRDGRCSRKHLLQRPW